MKSLLRCRLQSFILCCVVVVIVTSITIRGFSSLKYIRSRAESTGQNIFLNLGQTHQPEKSISNPGMEDIHLMIRRLSNSVKDTQSTETLRHVRLFCMVKTYPANFDTKAIAVKNTWGKRCDKLLFISSKGNSSLPAIGVLPKKNESRNLLAQKVFKGLRHVYDLFVNNYDWFYVCDDDTYTIVENMRLFLSVKDPSSLEYYGHRFHKFTPQGYTSGGGGYVISQEALRKFGSQGHTIKECNQSGVGSDFKVGQCLYKLGVVLKTSTDTKGRSRFHCFPLGSHLFGRYPKWYMNYTRRADGYDHGSNSISDYPISFHYTSGNKMYEIDHLLYHTGVYGLKIARLPQRVMHT